MAGAETACADIATYLARIAICSDPTLRNAQLPAPVSMLRMQVLCGRPALPAIDADVNIYPNVVFRVLSDGALDNVPASTQPEVNAVRLRRPCVNAGQPDCRLSSSPLRQGRAAAQ